MNAWVWVLSYTILGAAPQHGTLSKYATQAECQQSLDAMREERRSKGLQVVGSCQLVLKSGKNK